MDKYPGETETLMLQAGHQQKTFTIGQLQGQKGCNKTKAMETEILLTCIQT